MHYIPNWLINILNNLWQVLLNFESMFNKILNIFFVCQTLEHSFQLPAVNHCHKKLALRSYIHPSSLYGQCIKRGCEIKARIYITNETKLTVKGVQFIVQG